LCALLPGGTALAVRNFLQMGGQIAFPGAVRASDSDRERAVAVLRRHFALGRLTVEELEARVSRVYEASWRAELRELLRDLPFEIPVDRGRMLRGVDRFQRRLFRFHAWCYATFNTVLVSEWAWAGGHSFFWPAFSILPGGALVLWHRKGSRAASRRLRGGRHYPGAAWPRKAAARL
jgi:hypothetical protein